MNKLNVPRINVLGVGISAVNMQSFLQLIDYAIENGIGGYICVTGVHGVMEAQKDSAFKAILNSALLNTPDGMPMVWIGKFQRFYHVERVYGPDLMLEVCRFSSDTGYSHFFYGGNVGVADQLAARISKMFPNIKIVGTFTPPFRPLTIKEEEDLIEMVNNLKPDFFWVGLSTPKQERFMSKHIEKLNTNIMIGVGAAFDIHTSRIKDAPLYIKKYGMQWMHRLWQEPRRLATRYFVNNPKFVYKISLQLLGLKEYNLDDL